MSELPSHPPQYEDLHTQHYDIEQFEIEDSNTRQATPSSRLAVALQATQRVYVTCKGLVMAPILHYLTPLREAYRFASNKYELYILKVGNPLVVKRLIYVSFVMVLMYAVSMNENSDGVNGSSGGAFSSGKFYDVSQLGDSLHLYFDVKTLKENIEYLSSIPHFAGSTGDLALARYVESYFSNNGLESVDFNELDSFLNYPKADHTYVKLADDSFTAILHEENGSKMHHLAFNPNSPSSKGEIDRPYVYANFGTPSDFENLKLANVDVADTIVLLKYGGDVPEGNKIAQASHMGAKAVVFITPPIDWAGKKHEDAIRRLNVGLSRYSPGDVLTPGWSSHDEYVPRLKWEESAATSKIPSIPISWRDGKVLVEKLGKEGVDFGDGMFSGSNVKTRAAQVSPLKISVQNDERSTHLIWSVVGSITGREQADKGIIFGAPRDSLCFGASTSGSSTAVLLELVKVLTSLQRRYAWSPSRTIYFISFDATEYNLAGSAEWLESKKKQLMQQGYTYIELGGLANGDILDLNANPLLHDVIREEMKKVKVDPKKDKASKTLYDLYKETHGSEVFHYDLLQEKNYVPFVSALNIPSMEIGFRSKTDNGPVNSCLDTFQNLEIQTGSSMWKYQALVELLARIGLRVAEDPLIPYNFMTFLDALRGYQENLEHHVEEMMAANTKVVQPKLHFEVMARAIQTLKSKSQGLEEFRLDWKTFIESSSSLEPVMLAATRRSANDNMVAFNGFYVSTASTPLRAGYLNYLFGPPYDAPVARDGVHEWNTFPTIREFVAKGDLARAQHEIDRIAALIEESSLVLMKFL